MVCCFRPVDCLLPTSLPLPRLLFHINRGSLFSGEFPVNTKRSQLFNRALSADGYAPRLLEIRKCPARVRIPVSLWFEFERGSGGTLRRKWTCSHQVVDGLDFEISSASITHFRNGTHSRWGVSITSVLQVGTGVHVMTIPLQLKEINDLWNNYRYCFYASSRNSAHYSNSSYFNMVSSSLFFPAMGHLFQGRSNHSIPIFLAVLVASLFTESFLHDSSGSDLILFTILLFHLLYCFFFFLNLLFVLPISSAVKSIWLNIWCSHNLASQRGRIIFHHWILYDDLSCRQR